MAKKSTHILLIPSDAFYNDKGLFHVEVILFAIASLDIEGVRWLYVTITMQYPMNN
jgi:hypothetical protein